MVNEVKLETVSQWTEFLEDFRDTARSVMQREGWIIEDPRWFQPVPASEESIRNTESRLDVSIPREIRSFYLACNGWPSGPTPQAPINRIEQWTTLAVASSTVNDCAKNASVASWSGVSNDDPKLLDFRLDQGTRVLRSIAISFDTDDREVILLDPLADWQCGDWHSDNPAMKWIGSFGDFMNFRLDQWRNA